MNIDVIVNPLSYSQSGIHKCERYINTHFKKHSNIRIIPVNKYQKPGFISRYMNLFKKSLFYNMIQRDQRTSARVIYFSDQQLSFLLNFIDFKGIVVTMVYDIFPDTEFYRDKLSLFERLRYSFVIKAVKSSNLILTVSEMMKSELIKKYTINEKKIKVVRLGIDHDLYRPIDTQNLRSELGIDPDEKIILSVSSEEPRKNFENVLRAFKSLKDRYGKCRLIKIGRSAWRGARKKYLSIIKELDISGSVIFKEGVPEEEMPEYYCLCDIFLAIPLYEGGWANPVAEAMACGSPVIVSHELRELAENSGVMVDPNNYLDISNKMYDILTDKRKTDYMRNKSLEEAKKYSWENTANGIIKEINEYFVKMV